MMRIYRVEVEVVSCGGGYDGRVTRGECAGMG